MKAIATLFGTPDSFGVNPVTHAVTASFAGLVIDLPSTSSVPATPCPVKIEASLIQGTWQASTCVFLSFERPDAPIATDQAIEAKVPEAAPSTPQKSPKPVETRTEVSRSPHSTITPIQTQIVRPAPSAAPMNKPTEEKAGCSFSSLSRRGNSSVRSTAAPMTAKPAPAQSARPKFNSYEQGPGLTDIPF